MMGDELILMIAGLIVVKMLLAYLHTSRFLDVMYDRSNWMKLRKKHKPADGFVFFKNVFHPFRWTYSQMFDEI